MNKARRKLLNEIKVEIEALPDFDDLKQRLQDLLDEEQEAYDNMSEGLQGSERGQAMEEAISNISSAIDGLDSFDRNEIVGLIESAAERVRSKPIDRANKMFGKP